MKKSFILFVFLLCSIVVVAQKKSITGIITDTAGEAVIGASIVEVGTTNGTVSDVDGNFTLSVSDNASIQVSFIGFSSQTLSVQGKMNFKIILKEDSELLQEVPVDMVILPEENREKNAASNYQKYRFPCADRQPESYSTS